MTDDQFDKLMKKLEDMERQMKAGTWWPPAPTYPPVNPYPFGPSPYEPMRWGLPQTTDY